MLRKTGLVTFTLLCSLFAATFSYANPVPKPGPGVINDFTPSGTAIPKGAFGIMGNYIYAKKDRVWENGSSYGAINESTFNLFAIKPRYGLGNGWDIRASIPVIANDFSTDPSRNGLGDSILVLRKQLISQENNFPVSFGMGLGVVVPTGSTSYDGLGSGAWGLYGEIGVTYEFDGGRQLIEGAISYAYMGDGDAEMPDGLRIDDIDQNDAIRAQARYVIALNKYWDLGIEAQYYHVLESKIGSRGQNDEASSLFVGPALRLNIPQWNASIAVSPQFALYHDYEAASHTGAGPSAERFRLEVQILKNF